MNELLIVEKLNHYAAIEALAGDTDASVVRTLLEAMEAVGKACLGVEVLGRHSVGTANFLKIRMDVPYQSHWLPDRGCITMQPNGTFKVRLRGGREGKVPTPTMLSMQPNRRVYHGTVKSGWRLQFG